MANHIQGPKRRYPPELRERAVRMYFEAVDRAGERHGVVTRVAQQLGVGVAFLRDRARRSTAEMTGYITAHRERFGVEPICRALQVAPSTYYVAVSRQPSARAVGDEELKADVARVHQRNFGVYGVRKVWLQLKREAVSVGRDRVARLMRDLALVGVTRGTAKRTTIPAEVAERPGELVERRFTAPAPNRLWVADLTYVATWSGFERCRSAVGHVSSWPTPGRGP